MNTTHALTTSRLGGPRELDAGGEARYACAKLTSDWKMFGRTPTNRRAVEAIRATDHNVVYHDAGHDEIFALESCSADVTAADLANEHGMETYQGWLDRVGRIATVTTDAAHIGLEGYPDYTQHC
jgi:hypothetical protein